jgi:hypothetical protein
MTETEYRIEYSIQRCRPDQDDDFVEIGFGSSGGWSHLDQAMHMASSAVDCGEWETLDGMPDPASVLAEIQGRSRD